MKDYQEVLKTRAERFSQSKMTWEHNGTSSVALVALALLEVAAAIDRLQQRSEYAETGHIGQEEFQFIGDEQE